MVGRFEIEKNQNHRIRRLGLWKTNAKLSQKLTLTIQNGEKLQQSLVLFLGDTYVTEYGILTVKSN